MTEESDGGGQAFGATVTGIDIRADLIICPAFFGSDFFQCRPDIAFDRNGGSLGADIDIALFPAKTIECLFMGPWQSCKVRFIHLSFFPEITKADPFSMLDHTGMVLLLSLWII